VVHRDAGIGADHQAVEQHVPIDTIAPTGVGVRIAVGVERRRGADHEGVALIHPRRLA
jgi:hypothetical protein